ncbi:MAG: hypothetical protein K2L34_07705, partial [Muribaculaceae bacterium]|nr:hypothetical protein [Muribaculaceae bacterium]
MIKQLLLSAAVATMTVSATAQTNLPLVAEAVEGVSSELQEANQTAYEQVIAQIEALQAQYE